MRSRILKKTFKYFLATVALAAVGLFVFLFLLNRLPDTQEMRDFFFSRQAEFEKANAQIISSLMSEKPIRSKENKAAGYFYVEAQLTPSLSIKYYTHKRGVGVGAFGVGVAYLEAPPEKVYASLEDVLQDAAATEGFVGFGHLTGNWHYFLWELD